MLKIIINGQKLDSKLYFVKVKIAKKHASDPFTGLY